MLKKLAEEQASNSLAIIAEEISQELYHGKHRSAFHGYSSEFKEYKAYQTGDNLKQVDWKLYGRTDKLFTKHFHDESNISAYFFIDLSSSMFFPRENLEKINKSIQIIAVLCKILQKQRDKFGILGISNELLWESPLSNTKGHLHEIYKQLNDLLLQESLEKISQIPTILSEKVAAIGQRKIVFILTDLLFSDQEYVLFLQSLSEIKANKNTIKILHVWDLSERNLDSKVGSILQFKDIETNQVLSLPTEEWNQLQAKQHSIFIDQRINPILSKGYHYHSLCVNDSLFELIRQVI